MRPFLIEITDIAASDDDLHAMLAKARQHRDAMVELLKESGATEVHARSTPVRKKTPKVAPGEGTV